MPEPLNRVPIESYAAIGDGRTVALIDQDGRVGWLPLPELASLPAFAGMLDDGDGGVIELAPRSWTSRRRAYVPGTNVLRTTYQTETGSVRVTDALVTGLAGRLPWAELDRLVEGIEGEVELHWRVVPGTRLRTRSPWATTTDVGHVIRIADLTIGVTATGSARGGETRGGVVSGVLRTSPGSVGALCVTATEDEPLHLARPERAQEGVRRTIDGWRAWTEEYRYDGPWGDEVLRSALALKLLLSSATGSIAAAATTSLPERDAGGKNWDYRYAWIRDLTFTTAALSRFGLREETHAALSWLLTTIKRHGPELHVFYTLDGELDGHVSEYASPGWRDAGPVVTGNPASSQLQLGVYGDLLSMVRSYVSEGNVLDSDTRRFLADMADRVSDIWRSADSGLWELGEQHHYTTSKMACWQALDAAVWLAEHGHIAADGVAHWAAEAQRIKDWVADNCWSEERGSYLMHPDTDALDAAVLLHATSGFDRGPRMSATIDAVRAELGRGDLIYRYSGMDQEEHPFVACAFWVVSALACVGRMDEAVELMNVAVRRANDVGLLSEMVAEDGSFRGNLPQGLSHLALIDAAATIRELR